MVDGKSKYKFFSLASLSPKSNAAKIELLKSKI